MFAHTNLITYESLYSSSYLLNEYLLYDKLWGPSQRVVTLFLCSLDDGNIDDQCRGPSIKENDHLGFDIIALRERWKRRHWPGRSCKTWVKRSIWICYRLNLLVKTTGIHESSGQVDEAGGEIICHWAIITITISILKWKKIKTTTSSPSPT